MRELRHDFRAYYGTSYDNVPTCEAIDLICMLPAGSRYRAACDPRLAWNDDRHLMANAVDLLGIVNWRLMGQPPENKPHMIERPGDRERAERERKAAKEARKRIESTEWEEVG